MLIVRKVESADTRCVCGDPKEVHEHLRRGTDCGICGCRRFKAARVSKRRGEQGRLETPWIEDF